ncbi:hypothetical protein [Rhodococcus sp. SORGH_AS_0303]|nr:hypothetical protein [Rhodococcus sp. SORGH_AS_0303]MDQ1202849.1 ABC-type sulfate transport system permease subunit [Rhodococcus sp. SORGH_AS_0303]
MTGRVVTLALIRAGLIAGAVVTTAIAVFGYYVISSDLQAEAETLEEKS